MSTWVKIYNGMPSHPKLLRARADAGWLHLCGLCYSNEHLTDGFIAREVLVIAAPGVKHPERLAARLASVGLWHEVDGGWQIHEYSEYQRSASEVKERRTRDAERKAQDRASDGSPRGQNADSSADSSRARTRETRACSQDREEKAEKKREEKTNSSSSGSADADREARLATVDDLENCRLFFALGRDRNPKMKVPRPGSGERTAALRSMRLLRCRDGNTADEIQQAIRWLFTDPCDDAGFWGTTIQAPSGLRQHFPQLWSKMTVGSNVVQMRGQRRESAGDLIDEIRATQTAGSAA